MTQYDTTKSSMLMSPSNNVGTGGLAVESDKKHTSSYGAAGEKCDNLRKELEQRREKNLPGTEVSFAASRGSKANWITKT